MNLSDLLISSPMNNRCKLSELPVSSKPRTELDSFLSEMTDSLQWQIKFLNKKFGSFNLKKIIFTDVRGVTFPNEQLEVYIPYFEQNPRVKFTFNNVTGEFYVSKVRDRVLYTRTIKDLSDLKSNIDFEKQGLLTEKGYGFQFRNEDLHCKFFNNTYSIKEDMYNAMTNVMFKTIGLY